MSILSEDNQGAVEKLNALFLQMTEEEQCEWVKWVAHNIDPELVPDVIAGLKKRLSI